VEIFMFSALETPWKLTNRLSSLFLHPYIRLLFKFYGIPWGPGWHFYGIPIIQKHKHSLMKFGTGLSLRSSVSSNPLGPNHPAILCTWQSRTILKIGNNFAMTGGSICAAEKITIGDNVVVGANCTIVDTDFHPVSAELRRSQPQVADTAPVCIGDDIFIGMNSLILKGVTVGSGSVIGAGSVVTHDVPSHVVVGGNPARILKEL
jgi:acetyltransferase-like isoleucine patch superfamily enzyme